jgi:hypothetical protein
LEASHAYRSQLRQMQVCPALGQVNCIAASRLCILCRSDPLL